MFKYNLVSRYSLLTSYPFFLNMLDDHRNLYDHVVSVSEAEVEVDRRRHRVLGKHHIDAASSSYAKFTSCRRINIASGQQLVQIIKSSPRHCCIGIGWYYWLAFGIGTSFRFCLIVIHVILSLSRVSRLSRANNRGLRTDGFYSTVHRHVLTPSKTKSRALISLLMRSCSFRKFEMSQMSDQMSNLETI